MFGKYPKFLVLEYGIDHPWEMDFLLSIAIPDVAIITPISPNHIEQFGDFARYRDEKLKIFHAGKIILHHSLEDFKNEKSIIYGNWENIDFSLQHTEITEIGTKAIFERNSHKFSFTLPVFWEFQSENLLAIFAVAEILKIPFENLIKISQNFIPEAGRSRIFTGIQESLVIDGTYNGGVLSIIEGIYSLLSLQDSHKIFLFLGDMRELWVLTKEKHIEVAEKISEIFSWNKKNVEIFLVGPMTEKFMKQILEKKFLTHHSLSAREMGKILREKILENTTKKSIVFAKWSQNTIFLEEWLKYILDEADHQHLCRQSKEWLQKKEKFFEGK